MNDTAPPKPKRKSLSKKSRFDVFKRDDFRCQYCGASPPSATLEIDHIKPVSKNGGNSEDNLITACFDCNRGKAANELSVVPDTLANKLKIAEERADQLKAYEKAIRARKSAITRKVNKIEVIFQAVYSDREFTDSFKASVRSFLDKLPSPVVEDAMSLAVDRINDPRGALKYFCGICWARIREVENA